MQGQCPRAAVTLDINEHALDALFVELRMVEQQFSLWLSVSVVRYGVVVRAVRVESHLGRFYAPDREV